MPGISDYSERRHTMDLEAMDSEASELSWGSGFEPRSVRGRPPAEGGRYKGREATLDDPPQRIVPVSRDLRL